VVMASSAEPLMFVANLVRPGGNVTGLSAFANVLAAKRFEILRDTVPGITRIAGLMTMSNPVTPAQWKEIETAARTVGIEAQLFDVGKPEDFAPAFDVARRERVDALVVGLGSLRRIKSSSSNLQPGTSCPRFFHPVSSSRPAA